MLTNFTIQSLLTVSKEINNSKVIDLCKALICAWSYEISFHDMHLILYFVKDIAFSQ